MGSAAVQSDGNGTCSSLPTDTAPAVERVMLQAKQSRPAAVYLQTVASTPFFPSIGKGRCTGVDGKFVSLGWAACVCGKPVGSDCSAGSCPSKDTCQAECDALPNCAAFNWYNDAGNAYCWFYAQMDKPYVRVDTEFTYYECFTKASIPEIFTGADCPYCQDMGGEFNCTYFRTGGSPDNVNRKTWIACSYCPACQPLDPAPTYLEISSGKNCNGELISDGIEPNCTAKCDGLWDCKFYTAYSSGYCQTWVSCGTLSVTADSTAKTFQKLEEAPTYLEISSGKSCNAQFVTNGIEPNCKATCDSQQNCKFYTAYSSGWCQTSESCGTQNVAADSTAKIFQKQ